MGRMQQRLKEILERALKEIRECREVAQLEKSRVKYLGKKGELTVFLGGWGICPRKNGRRWAGL